MSFSSCDRIVPDAYGNKVNKIGNIARICLVACSTVALAAYVSGQAMAQSASGDASLPQVTVEAAKAKSSKPKKKPQAKAPPASVQEDYEPAPAVTAQPIEQQPVEPRTGSGRDRALQDNVYKTPGAVSTAGSSELSTFGQLDTGDVLRTMPGTSVRENPQNPGMAVNIRGFEGSGRVNMMIDGVRQNFRFTGHEAQGFAYVDPSLLAGIDISRGAISTAGGAGALAGAANFRTLDIIDVLKPGQNAGALTSVSYGTNGQGLSGMAAGAVTNGNVGFVGAISGRSPDNFENGNGVIVPYTEQDLTSGLVKGEFRLNEEHKIKLGGVFYRNDFLANSYDQNISSDIFTANYIYNPIGNDLVYLRANAYRSDITMTYGLSSTGAWTDTQSGRVINDVGTGFDVTNISKLRFGDVKVRAEYGLEYFHDDVNVINSTARPDFGVNPSGESSIFSVFQSTTFSYGIFDLIAGLRYDQASLEGKGEISRAQPVLGLPAGPFEIDWTKDRVNPKITLAATPLPWLQPYVTYAEAFRAPTVNESLAGGSHPTGTGVTQSFFPNPFLEPEVQKGWEFGFNIFADRVLSSRDSFRFKANYFTQDVEDYITADFAGGTHFANVPGTTKVDGVEIQGNYDAGYMFAGLVYTYAHSELPFQINGFGAASNLPEHVLVLTGGFRFFDEALTVGARAQFVSESHIGEFNASLWGVPEALPSYQLVDLFANYKVTEDIDLGVNIANVFDEAYTPPMTTYITGGSPLLETGRGRTAIFTARARF